FSTIEEQFLYFFYVPAILSLAVAVTGFVPRAHSARAQLWRRLGMAVLCLFLLYDLGLWVQTRTSRDNGLQQVVTWLKHDRDLSGPVANDTTVTAYLEQRSGLKAVAAGRPALAAAEGVRYVTILS